jgi:hypothetical protein
MVFPVVGNKGQDTKLKEASDGACFPYFKQAVSISLTFIP